MTSPDPRAVPTAAGTAPTQALVLIDAQVNMFDPSAPVVGSDALIERLSSLLQWTRASHLPIVFVRNCGPAGAVDELGTPGWELHPALQPAVGDRAARDVTAAVNGVLGARLNLKSADEVRRD
jgi:nicotinamidase-related amidase